MSISENTEKMIDLTIQKVLSESKIDSTKQKTII